MDGPPNPALPKLNASNERMRTDVSAISRRGASTAGITEHTRRPAPPPGITPRPAPPKRSKKTTLGAIAEALAGGEALPESEQEFNPSEYLREHTPANTAQRTGAGLAGAALGRMFKRR